MSAPLQLRLCARTLAQLIAATILAAAVLGTAPASAGGPQPAQSTPEATARAKRLDALFASLKTAKEEAEGDAIVADIWKTWLQSGQPQLDANMEAAIKMMAYGLLVQAMAILDELVALAPDWAEAWNKRATVLYLLGEHDRSLADIDRVLALEPRHFGALAGQGLIRMAREEYREALAAFRKALSFNPFLKERFELIPSLERKVGEKPI